MFKNLNWNPKEYVEYENNEVKLQKETELLNNIGISACAFGVNNPSVMSSIGFFAK